MLFYNFAIRQLGSAQTAAFGALTPILALMGSFVFLGESITAILNQKKAGTFILKIFNIGYIYFFVFNAKITIKVNPI